MSQENVQVVLGMVEGFNSTPRTDLERWVAEFFDPEIEWHDVPSLPDGGVHFGRDAYLRHVKAYREAWDTMSIVVEAIRAGGRAGRRSYSLRRYRQSKRSRRCRDDERVDRRRLRLSSRANPSSAAVR